jgi:hypothetical protein
VIDGNYSSVLAPGLLREMTANHNIYEPVLTHTSNAPLVCDADGVQEWLASAVFAPVLVEANASADGALNATRGAQLLAILAANVAANLSHAAEDCSMPEVSTLALIDQGRAVLRAAGVATGPCAAFSELLSGLTFAPALDQLNASKLGALNDTHADLLRALLGQQFLPALLANSSTCDPALVSNATLEAQARDFALGLLQNSALAGLFTAVFDPKHACTLLFSNLAVASTESMLESLNATAGRVLNATHASAMRELVQEHLIAPLANSGVNCTDPAALSAAMQSRTLQLQLALAQHPLFRAHQALPPDAQVVVEMTVRLGMSRAQFDGAAREQYRKGIASACSVALAAVRIAAVRVVGVGGRRLLQAATPEQVEVDTEVDTPPTAALAVLTAADNSTAVQESVQAQMDGDVQVETVGTPTVAPRQEPAPGPAPSPAQPALPKYAGQHSANSTDEGSWSIFVVALLLLLLAFVVVFASVASLWHWDSRGRAPVASESAQPPPYLCTQLGYTQEATPEQQKLLSKTVVGDPYALHPYAYSPAYAP